VSTEDRLSLPARLWFAWLCFFRVLFDGAFAARVHALPDKAQPPALPPSPPSPPPSPAKPAAPVTTTDERAALLLLGLLQREGRLVDFLQQDIAAFSDADVGVAARVVHEGCRKVLSGSARIEPVMDDSEGARVRLEAGFDPDRVKLVGEVRGEAPYAGVLRHRGWRAARLELPKIVGGHDASILAPAEVELG
jgi:hypothetical protein